MRVCLIIEGAYPYIVGGVSVWVHLLIQNLPHIEFVLWTITPERNQPLKYELPPNVVEHVEVALDMKLPLHARKKRTRSQWQIIQHFHQDMDEGRIQFFHDFLHQFMPHDPGGLSADNIFHDFESWQLLKEMYEKHHPITPFIKYYWTWRATHMPLFKMLHARIPHADVYHAVSTGYAGLLGAMAKIRTGRPFLLTEHGIYAKEREMEINQSEIHSGYEREMWKNMFRSLAKIAYTHADRIIALFQKNQNLQLSLGAPPERCFVIPNGIRVRDFLKIERKPHEHFNVGFIGRLVPIKDVKTFVLAARIIRDALPQARFYIIGPQDERDDYFQELKILVDNLELNDVIEFTGKVDVKTYFPILDVLCLTSVKEAQPLSIIEAMVAGVPVVATRVGDVEDILQDDGIVVPPKRPDKLADGVIRFASDPEFRRRCIQNARERAVRRYDLDALIQRYDELYQEYAKPEAERWRA